MQGSFLKVTTLKMEKTAAKKVVEQEFDSPIQEDFIEWRSQTNGSIEKISKLFFMFLI